MSTANPSTDQLAQMCLEAFVRAFLIGAHQARITRHIGGR